MGDEMRFGFGGIGRNAGRLWHAVSGPSSKHD
jgi:hypothetical protein